MIPKQEYTEKHLKIGTLRHRLVKPAVYEYLKNGATLIANKIKHSAKVDKLSRQVAVFTGRQVVSSAYVALGEKESSPCHWDTRDVFAIQLIGRKHWIIYEPSMKSPIFTQQSKDYKDQHPCPSVPYMDIILEAGDILYIPRGWWHNPLPLGEPTFHLSVGTFPALIVDYLSWLLTHIENYADARQSLNNWRQDSRTLASVGNHINELINNPENYRHFTDEFTGATRIDSPLALEFFGHSSASALPEHLGLRICAICYRSLDSGYIIANGTRLNLDSKSLKIIHHLVESPGSSTIKLINKLPEIPSSELITIIAKLCQQDILEILDY
ncbi:JmjC domain-containing protein [Pseudomonas azerbaijanoccidentalis]